MNSDPNERSRRSVGASNWSWGVGGLTVLSALIPSLVFAQTSSAATIGESFAFFANPSFVAAFVCVFVVVMVFNSAFVAGEYAVDLLRPAHLKLHDQNERSFRILSKVLGRKDSFVAASVMGAQTMRAWLVLLSLVPGPGLSRAFGWTHDSTPVEEVVGWSILAGALVSIPVMGINVIFAELVAKSYSATIPDRATIKLYPILSFFSIVFRLPGMVAMSIAGLVTRRFGTDAKFTTDRAEEEIKEILSAVEDEEGTQNEERQMLHSVFEFGDTVAREVMTPRVDLESVPVTANLEEVANLVEATGLSRFPVYEENDDEIIGIVHAKDVLGELARGKTTKGLREIMREAFHVPEGTSLHKLLAEMKARKSQLVVVTDEFGGTSGIVTMEDIVEEIVGEITDEYDTEAPDIVAKDSAHSVSGKIHLDDLNSEIGTEFFSEEFDTIGGYVFGLFGRQPKTGEHIHDETHSFTVEESDGRRILRVLIEDYVEPDLEREETLA